MTNNTTADLDRDIAHLIDSSENGIARVPRETLVRLRELFALQHSPIRDEQREVARKRVAAFMDAYSILRGADQEKIHSINFTPLLVADLRALLTSPRAALPMTDDARECLMDVVSHHDNIVAGFAAQRNAATEADDSGDIAYWNHEINVAHRMQEQAKRALDAAPAAPVADPLRRRVERLLVELHAEGRLSEGQCAKMLDIPRIDWRELAEFLAPAAQAVAADGEATDQWVAKAQSEFVSALILAICELPDRSSPEGEPGAMVANSDEIAHCVDVALEKTGLSISRRAAVSPATAEPRECCNADCGWKGDVAETITMKHGFPAALCPRCHEVTECGEKSAKADERADWSAIRHSLAIAIAAFGTRPDGRRGTDAAAQMLESITEPGSPLSWLRASQVAAPAEAREPVGRFDKSLNQIRWRDGLVNADFADRQPFYTYPVGVPADAGEAVASVDETTFKHLFYKHGGPVDSEGWCINESGLRDFLADLAAAQGAQGGKGGEA